jgi:hypothetical protein
MAFLMETTRPATEEGAEGMEIVTNREGGDNIHRRRGLISWRPPMGREATT